MNFHHFLQHAKFRTAEQNSLHGLWVFILIQIFPSGLLPLQFAKSVVTFQTKS